MAGSFGFGQSVGFDDFERGVVFEPLLQIGHFGGGRAAQDFARALFQDGHRSVVGQIGRFGVFRRDGLSQLIVDGFRLGWQRRRRLAHQLAEFDRLFPISLIF